MADIGRPSPPELPATDGVAPVNTLTKGEGVTPVNDAELVLCDRLTTAPGDTCLYAGATVVTDVDNCSATGAASHFSTTTINRPAMNIIRDVIRPACSKVKTRSSATAEIAGVGSRAVNGF